MDIRPASIHQYGENKWELANSKWGNAQGYQGLTIGVVKKINTGQSSLKSDNQQSSNLRAI
tara:strand:+ start:1172 stop:1354 length:183 start_codon:yes stop_codon:yes gene_type:complete